MSTTLNVGLLQYSPTADVAANVARLAEGVGRLAGVGAQLVVFEELHNTPYFCQEEDVRHFDLAESVPGPTTDLLRRLAAETHVVIVASLFERRATGLYHNTAAVIDSDGALAGIYRKEHIPDDPGFYEKFYFTPGDLGFHPIATSVGRLGVLVCWDQWYPEAARLMALEGADILIYPTAIGWDPGDSPEERERQRQAWITVQRGHAVANALPLVAVNRVGFEAAADNAEQEGEHTTGIDFWGSSFVCGPQGEVLYQAPHDQEVCVNVPVDLQRSEQVRRIWPFLRDRRIEHYNDLTLRFRD